MDSSSSDAGSEVSLGPETDRFGFIVTNGSAAGNVGPSPELVMQREAKWINIMDRWNRILEKKSSKVKVECQKGIPASLRVKCWPLLCGASDRMKQNEKLFKFLDSQPGPHSWVDVIERDLDRQFPFHEMFLSKDGHGQRGLFRVLKAYTQYQPEEGYCQAQGPVAAVLLMNMPAEEAFWCLVQISEQYLPGYYNSLLEGVQFDAALLSWIVKKTCPAAHKHLQHHGVEPLMFATDWLMCLFTRHLPFNTLLRVWDLFFCYGVRVLLQVSAVLVRRVLGKPELRKECQGQMETLERLRGIRDQIQEDDDAFISEVCSVPLSNKDLHKQVEKQLQQWRQDRPSSTFDPRGRCHGYKMAWERARLHREQRERREREKGNLSVPLARSSSTLSLSPSLFEKRWKKGGNTSEGGKKITRHRSMGAREDWRSWTDFSFKKAQVLKEEDEDVSATSGSKTGQNEPKKLSGESKTKKPTDTSVETKDQTEKVEIRISEEEMRLKQKDETTKPPTKKVLKENQLQITEREVKLDTARQTVEQIEKHKNQEIDAEAPKNNCKTTNTDLPKTQNSAVSEEQRIEGDIKQNESSTTKIQEESVTDCTESTVDGRKTSTETETRLREEELVAKPEGDASEIKYHSSEFSKEPEETESHTKTERENNERAQMQDKVRTEERDSEKEIKRKEEEEALEHFDAVREKEEETVQEAEEQNVIFHSNASADSNTFNSDQRKNKETQTEEPAEMEKNSTQRTESVSTEKDASKPQITNRVNLATVMEEKESREQEEETKEGWTDTKKETNESKVQEAEEQNVIFHSNTSAEFKTSNFDQRNNKETQTSKRQTTNRVDLGGEMEEKESREKEEETQEDTKKETNESQVQEAEEHSAIFHSDDKQKKETQTEDSEKPSTIEKNLNDLAEIDNSKPQLSNQDNLESREKEEAIKDESDTKKEKNESKTNEAEEQNVIFHSNTNQNKETQTEDSVKPARMEKKTTQTQRIESDLRETDNSKPQPSNQVHLGGAMEEKENREQEEETKEGWTDTKKETNESKVQEEEEQNVIFHSNTSAECKTSNFDQRNDKETQTEAFIKPGKMENNSTDLTEIDASKRQTTNRVNLGGGMEEKEEEETKEGWTDTKKETNESKVQEEEENVIFHSNAKQNKETQTEDSKKPAKLERNSADSTETDDSNPQPINQVRLGSAMEEKESRGKEEEVKEGSKDVKKETEQEADQHNGIFPQKHTEMQTEDSIKDAKVEKNSADLTETDDSKPQLSSLVALDAAMEEKESLIDASPSEAEPLPDSRTDAPALHCSKKRPDGTNSSSAHHSGRPSADLCVRKPSNARSSKLTRKLSEDLFTCPLKTSQSQTGTDPPSSSPAKTEAAKEPPKRLRLIDRLRGKQPKKKIQVPKILIQDFSEVTCEEAEKKVSSKERRRIRREREREEKEEESLKKKREKEMKKERRKPRSAGKREKSPVDDGVQTGSKTLRHAAPFAESYF